MNLPGYNLEITGGSVKAGFPMKRGAHTSGPLKILMGNGVGYKAEKGQRARRRVHGEIVGDYIVQVNTRIKEYGGKSVESLLGIDKTTEAQEAQAAQKKSDQKGGQ